MAEPQKQTHQTNPRSSCCVGCFGFSGKKKSPEKTTQRSSKSKTCWLAWPMFCLGARKQPCTKTVPVDNTEKVEPADSETQTAKLIKKKSDSKLCSSKHPSPNANHKPSRQNSNAHLHQQAASSKKAARETPKETRLHGHEPIIILGNRKLLDPTTTGSSLQGSPNIIRKPKTETKLSHTVSLPTVKANPRVGNPRIHARINLKDEIIRKKMELVENFDPVKGMSIIMVTLITMLLWGRLCAILCTSAWFYFLPLLSNHH